MHQFSGVDASTSLKLTSIEPGRPLRTPRVGGVCSAAGTGCTVYPGTVSPGTPSRVYRVPMYQGCILPGDRFPGTPVPGKLAVFGSAVIAHLKAHQGLEDRSQPCTAAYVWTQGVRHVVYPTCLTYPWVPLRRLEPVRITAVGRHQKQRAPALCFWLLARSRLLLKRCRKPASPKVL